jgi:uncharacterized membrane protein YdbT with pleckstrin-like domain
MHFPFLIKIHHGELEKPLIFMRKHAVILIGHSLLYLVLAAFPFIALLVLPDVIAGWLAHEILGPITVLLLSLFELFVLLLFYSAFMDWYLDIWVVTDERIVDVNQSGVFAREIAELRHDKIQDVSVEQKGFFATVFGYGRIHVQTAGESTKFEFAGIPKPNEVARHILELAHADSQYHQETLAARVRGEEVPERK